MRPHVFHPESQMMSHGYHPEWSEGAIKCPVYQTSTFVFPNARAGKEFFEVAYGKREQGEGEELGLIYSRLNNPDIEITEARLCLWERAEAGALFNSGMAAISTVLLEFLRPGDLLLYSRPVYGGTAHFIDHVLPQYGIAVMGFSANEEQTEIRKRVAESGMANRLALIYAETPANPTGSLVDIAGCRALADELSTAHRTVPVVVDNTYMGPLWQQPLKHGADLVVYSATKYLGGHSDLIAGAVLGSRDLIGRIKGMRTFMGNMATPYTGWLLMRSLETLQIRMEKQAANALKVAAFVRTHPAIQKVHFLGFLTPEDGQQYERYRQQCLAPGAMISFELKGSESEVFAFLDQLQLIKLAVSLGSTESLIQHPYTMTHAGLTDEEKISSGISEGLVRLSVGVEHPDDLIWDLGQALSLVDSEKRSSTRDVRLAG